MAPSERIMTEAGIATLAERRAGMSDSRTGSGVELVIDRLYKVTGNRCSGRTYQVHAIAEDQVLATEGSFQGSNTKRRAPDDLWTWSPAGERWIPRDRLSWIRDVGRIPDVGEPRFRFRWGMEPG
jgi:hypothetical protein